MPVYGPMVSRRLMPLTRYSSEKVLAPFSETRRANPGSVRSKIRRVPFAAGAPGHRACR